MGRSALAVDLISGGFPCQDLSVAGKRAGLSGERSGLFFEFARIADDLLGSGGWVLIENVPGLLSSNGGRDFAVLLATLAELGFHDLAWRVLDSRYLGVPQRRRRVFILARRARGRSASEVLLEPESGGGDFEASRKEGPRPPDGVGGGIARALDTRGGEADDNEAQSGQLIAGQLTRRTGKGPNTTLDDGALVGPDLGSQERTGELCRDTRGVDADEHFSDGEGPSPDPDGNGTTPRVSRRLDDATCAHDPKPDGPRYAACGDAVTVQVAYWIGRRLADEGSKDG